MKKRLKKSVAILLLLSMTFSLLSGCGKSKEASTGTGDEVNATSGNTGEAETGEGGDSRYIDDGGLTWDTQENMYVIEEDVLNGKAPLKLWVDNEKLGAAIQEGFTKKYPNVNLTVEVVMSTDTISKMSLEGEAGTGADVFIIPHDGVGTAMNSAIIGMMGRYGDIIEERFLESAVNTVKFDNAIYGVPFLTECVGLIYNKTLLQKLYEEGVIDSPEPVTEMSQLLEFGRKYNDPANNKWAFRWQASDSYMNFCWLTSAGYQLFGPDHNDPDQVNLNSKEVVDGLTFYKQFREIWDVNSGDANWDTTTIEFAKGETPYLISGPWSMENCYKGAEENNFEVGVTPLPTINGKQPYTFSGVQLACVSSYSKYPAAARALAMYIGSDEILSFLYKELGKLPALKDSSTVPGLSEDTNVQAFMKQAEYSIAMPIIPEISYYWTATENMYKAVWDGVLSPQEAADKAQVDFDALRASVQ